MSSIVLFNSSNFSSYNGRLTYKVSGATLALKGKEVGLQQISMYNSFPNVRSNDFENFPVSNVIIIRIPVWDGSTQQYTNFNSFELEIPTGFYSYEDFNFLIQNFCINNGLYLIDPATGNNIYFFQLSVNGPRYRIQLDVFRIPTAAQAATLGYVSGGMVLNPGNRAITPQIQLTDKSPCSVWGFDPGFYPTTPAFSNSSAYSHAAAFEIMGQKPPQINQVTAIRVHCNLVMDVTSYPVDLIAQVPIEAAYGGSKTFQPSEITHQAISDGFYDNIVVYFTDQNQNILIPGDPQITLALVIKDRDTKK